MKTDQKKSDLPRREFLRLAGLMPLALALGCSEDASTAEVENAIRKFIFAVGPWGEDQRSDAESFATRFMAAGAVSEVFLEQVGTAKTLAGRAPFSTGPMKLDELDLSGCSAAEKKLLTDLVQQIYGLLEVQYVYLRGEPDIGGY